MSRGPAEVAWSHSEANKSLSACSSGIIERDFKILRMRSREIGDESLEFKV